MAEIKLLYVRPADHEAKLGVTILQRLLADARGFGYEHVHLDTAPFMYAAHKLNEAANFVDCAPMQEAKCPPFCTPNGDSWKKALHVQ